MLHNFDLQILLQGQNMKRKTNAETKNIEGYLTVQEINYALKNAKNNKTP